MINRGRQPDRFLATILFTDVVGSTDLAAKVGDAQWRRLIDAHHAAVRAQLRKFNGREVDTAGDGFMCSFEQPAQAVRAADAILTDVARLGLELRAGVHTGECERIGGKIGGIAVHTAARVMAAAAAGQVLVSSTVRDLVAGSGLEFADAGTRELKGVPGEWHLFALARDLDAPGGDAVTIAATIGSARPTSAKSSRRMVALAAIGLIGIAVVSVAIALGSGLLSGRSAAAITLGPDQVLTIDGATNKVVASHRVPSGPVAVVFDESSGRLWVASLDAGVLTDFAVDGQGQDRTTGRVGRPTDIALGDGLVWVADVYDKSVTRVDATTGEAQPTIQGVVARRIAYGAGSGWAIDDLVDRLLRLDRQSGQVAQEIDLGAGAYPNGLAVGADSVWVGNVGPSTLSRIDTVRATVTVPGIALRGVPEVVSSGTHDVWIAARDNDIVMRVDPSTNSVSQTISVGDQPMSIAADGDTVWVGCAGTNEVWHLAHDGTVLAKIGVGGVPSDIAVGGGRVYVTVRSV